MTDWLQISSYAVIVAFFLYCFSFIAYAVAVGGSRFSNREPEAHRRRWGNIGLWLAAAGWAAHLVYFFARWAGAGHIPVSNLYEFLMALGIAMMLAFFVIRFAYGHPLLGAFALPLTIIIVAYASVFPSEVQPLVPALNSIWLRLHVTTAVVGEAFFAVGFTAALILVLRVTDFSRKDKSGRRARFWAEFTLMVIVIVIGFLAAVFGFRAAGYHAEFRQETVIVDARGNVIEQQQTVEYGLPPIFKPYNSETVSMDPFLGMTKPLFETPSWMNGVNAGRKWNTVVWSVIVGLLLYGLLRLILRKPLSKAIQPFLDGIDPDDLDEISYRAIAIGFPLFTLGALVFAMIWAQIAWSRFWGWDPKEVWALITWLFYSAYLHLRLSRGWHGIRSAWLAVIGFLVVMFTLIGVNLLIAGLHSYAGVS